MKKQINRVIYPLVALLIISVIGIKALAAPLTFKLSREIGEFNYLRDTYGVKVIRTTDTEEIAYCLEINDDYPKTNHAYTSLGHANEELSKLLDISFPMVSGVDMGVDDDSEAYLATQILVWTLIDRFDVNKITTKNKNTQKAIRRLYKEVKANPTSPNKYQILTPSNKNIQDLVMGKMAQDVKPEPPKEPSENNDNGGTVAPEEGNKGPTDSNVGEDPNVSPDGNVDSTQPETTEKPNTSTQPEIPVKPNPSDPVKNTQPKISELG